MPLKRLMYLCISCPLDAHKVCLDRSGNEIWEGEKYIPPGSDACTSCRCVAGKPEMCLTSMCAQPPCENYQPDPDKCCHYICIDGGDADDKPKCKSILPSLLSCLDP